MRYLSLLFAAAAVLCQVLAELDADIISEVITGLQAEEEEQSVCRGVLGDAVGLPEFIVEAVCEWFDQDAVKSRESSSLEKECPSSAGVVRVGEVLLSIQDVDLLVASGWGGGTPCVAWATLKRRTLEETKILSCAGANENACTIDIEDALLAISEWEEELKKPSRLFRFLSLFSIQGLVQALLLAISTPVAFFYFVFGILKHVISFFFRHFLTGVAFGGGVFTIGAAALILERRLKVGLGAACVSLLMMFGCSSTGIELWLNGRVGLASLFIAAGSAALVGSVLTLEIVVTRQKNHTGMYSDQFQKLCCWVGGKPKRRLPRDKDSPHFATDLQRSSLMLDGLIVVHSGAVFQLAGGDSNAALLLVPGALACCLLTRDFPQKPCLQVLYAIAAMFFFDPSSMCSFLALFSPWLAALLSDVVQSSNLTVAALFRSALPIGSAAFFVFFLGTLFLSIHRPVRSWPRSDNVVWASFMVAFSVHMMQGDHLVAASLLLLWKGGWLLVCMVYTEVFVVNLPHFVSSNPPHLAKACPKHGDKPALFLTALLLITWTASPLLNPTLLWPVIMAATTFRTLILVITLLPDVTKELLVFSLLTTCATYGCLWCRLLEQGAASLFAVGVVVVCAVGAAAIGALAVLKSLQLYPASFDSAPRVGLLWGWLLVWLVNESETLGYLRQVAHLASGDGEGKDALLRDGLYAVGILFPWLTTLFLGTRVLSFESKAVTLCSLLLAFTLLPAFVDPIVQEYVDPANLVLFFSRACVEDAVDLTLSAVGVQVYGMKRLASAISFYALSVSLSLIPGYLQCSPGLEASSLDLGGLAHRFYLVAYLNFWLGATAFFLRAKPELKTYTAEIYRLGFVGTLFYSFVTLPSFDFFLCCFSIFLSIGADFIEDKVLYKWMQSIPSPMLKLLNLVVDMDAAIERVESWVKADKDTKGLFVQRDSKGAILINLTLFLLLFSLSDHLRVLEPSSLLPWWRSEAIEFTSAAVLFGVLAYSSAAAVRARCAKSFGGQQENADAQRATFQVVRNALGLVANALFLCAQHRRSSSSSSSATASLWSTLWSLAALASFVSSGVVHVFAASDGKPFLPELQCGVNLGAICLAALGMKIGSSQMVAINTLAAAGLVGAITAKDEKVVIVSPISRVATIIAFVHSLVVKSRLLMLISLGSLIPFNSLKAVGRATLRFTKKYRTLVVGALTSLSKGGDITLFFCLLFFGVSLMIVSVYMSEMWASICGLFGIATPVMQFLFSIQFIEPLENFTLPRLPQTLERLVVSLVLVGRVGHQVFHGASCVLTQQEIRPTEVRSNVSSSSPVVTTPAALQNISSNPPLPPAEPTSLPQHHIHTLVTLLRTQINNREATMRARVVTLVQSHVRKFQARHRTQQAAAALLSDGGVVVRETTPGRLFGSQQKTRIVMLDASKQYILVRRVLKKGLLLPPKPPVIEKIALRDCIAARATGGQAGTWSFALQRSSLMATGDGGIQFEASGEHELNQLCAAISVLRRDVANSSINTTSSSNRADPGRRRPGASSASAARR